MKAQWPQQALTQVKSGACFYGVTCAASILVEAP